MEMENSNNSNSIERHLYSPLTRENIGCILFCILFLGLIIIIIYEYSTNQAIF